MNDTIIHHIVDDVMILNVDYHLVQKSSKGYRNNYVLLPYIPMVALYMQSIQVGSTMVAEIMYAK